MTRKMSETSRAPSDPSDPLSNWAKTGLVPSSADPKSQMSVLVFISFLLWQKLLQLQFATDPRGVLAWMLEQGVGATLDSYGVSIEVARREAAAGTLALTRWTGALREAMQRRPGHTQLFAALRRAAFTEDGGLLFVNAGIDPARPLETQSDSFWWSSGAFGRILAPYGGFRRVVRGFDPNHGGMAITDYTATIDGGCGFGGPLVAACLLPDGEIIDKIES